MINTQFNPAKSNLISSDSDAEFSLKNLSQCSGLKSSESPQLDDYDGMRIFCRNLFNHVIRAMNELLDLLFLPPEEMEDKIEEMGGRDALSDRLDLLDLNINTLINYCGGFLPQDRMDDLRSLRERVDDLRRAFGFEMEEGPAFTALIVDTSGVQQVGRDIGQLLQLLLPFLGGSPAGRPGFGAP